MIHPSKCGTSSISSDSGKICVTLGADSSTALAANTGRNSSIARSMGGQVTRMRMGTSLEDAARRRIVADDPSIEMRHEFNQFGLGQDLRHIGGGQLDGVGREHRPKFINSPQHGRTSYKDAHGDTPLAGLTRTKRTKISLNGISKLPQLCSNRLGHQYQRTRPLAFQTLWAFFLCARASPQSSSD